MNKNNAKDFLPLVQALSKGKTIQCWQVGNGSWEDKKEVEFNAISFESYRVKPEPIEIYVNVYDTANMFGNACETREKAEGYNRGAARTVMFREVIEND